MFLFYRAKQPIHQPPSFPRRRESRLQKAAAIFKDFHSFQNLDSRLRGNDEAGIFHLHLLKRSLDSDFKCNTRVPVVGTDSRIKHLAFRSQVFFSAGGSTHLEPCVSPDR